MEEFVRPLQSPSVAPGYRTPPTAGINEGDPTLAIGSPPSGQTDLGPYARTDEPEDYGWFPRLRVLLAGVQEVVSVRKDVAETFEIDANVCSVWRLRCRSESLSLSFAAIETPTWLARGFIWGGVRRMATVRIYVDWETEVSDARILAMPGVRFSFGESPDWSLGATRDVFQVQITSDGELYCTVIALNIVEAA